MSGSSTPSGSSARWVARLRLEHFGCFTAPTELALTRLHALIGPNDTGKTTALRAIERALMQDRPPTAQHQHLMGYARELTRLELDVAGVRVELSSTNLDRTVRTELGGPPRAPFELPPARFLRLDPDVLKAPAPLLRTDEPLFFRGERGGGLGALLDALRDRDESAYDTVRASFLDTFPAVERLQLQRPSDQGKTPAVRMRTGEEVPAERMSEGMLYWLALAALRATGFDGVVLLEEPENGLHPARVAEAVRVLRDASSRMQIVMATHSPLVVNELEADEITVLHRDEGGVVRATPMRHTFDYDARARVYSNGELWLAHADGEREHDLFHGASAPSSGPPADASAVD